MAVPRQSAVHMAGAFLAMGGWAIFANRSHPMPDPLIAGILQGALSALITLFLKRMIEALSMRLSGSYALVLPPLGAAVVSFVLLVTLHSLAGTPEIAATIAIPLIVSTSYALLYSYSLWRRA
jgi:ABC-type cobalamin transport system permease subunit